MIEIKHVFNYETIRDFCGSVFTQTEYDIKHGFTIYEKDLWMVLSLFTFSKAVEFYARDMHCCYESDNSLFMLDNFDDRYSAIKDAITRYVNEDQELVDMMIKSLESGVYKSKVIETVYTKLVRNWDFNLQVIINGILYTDKFLLYLEYTNTHNSKLARKLMHKQFMSMPTVWDGSKSFHTSMWVDLED